MSIENDTFASYKLLDRALAKRGYAMEFNEVSPATATYVSPSGARWATPAARIAYPFNCELVRATSIDKMKTYGFAGERGFAVPFTRELDGGITEAEAWLLFETYHSLVVKPADFSQARGVTLDVVSYGQLVQAVNDAKVFSSRVLVQEQVTGEELRFTVIQGKVKNVLLRRTPQVTGDGTHSLKELIEHENNQRQKLQLECVSYPQLDETLIDPSFITSSSVPKNGEVIELNHSTTIKGGCSVYNVTNEVDASYIQAVEGLVADLHAGFIVVDVFCTEYRTPRATGNHWLIEFNTAPALKMYYGCRDDRQYDIAAYLAELIGRHLVDGTVVAPVNLLTK